MSKTKVIFWGSLLTAMFLAFYSITLQSNDVQPPTPGLAGDPGQTTCNHCHAGTTTTDASKFIFKLSPDSAGLAGSSHIVTTATHYIPDSVQWLSLTLNGTAVKYGFQITAVNASAGRADSFLLVNTANTSRQRSTTRSYVGHKAASTNTTWLIKWHAPHSGNVTFYYTGNLADGDGSSDGDSVYQSMATVSAMPLGITETTSVITTVLVYPVPISNHITTAIQFSKSTSLDITLLDIYGSTIKQLYNGMAQQGQFINVYSLDELPTGTYLLKVETDNGIVVKKVMKY